MTRGGSRSGSGPKPLLDEQEEISVGSICERKWQDIATQSGWDEYERRLYIKDIRVEQDILRKIPVVERSSTETLKKIEDAKESVGDILKYANTVAAEDVPEFPPIEAERARMNKLAAERGGPEPMTITRPYDAKAKVLEAGVHWAQAQFDKKISGKTAERCWERFREFEASIRDTWKPPV